jgi:hypothetical protein
MSEYGANNATDYPAESVPVKGRSCAIISLVTAAALLWLFFMPWLTVSCDGQALMASAPPEIRYKAIALAQQMGIQVDRLIDKRDLASANGWELAAGELAPAEDLVNKADAKPPQIGDGVPKSRWWVYMGLGLPGLLVLICGFAAVGPLPSRAGKWMLLFGLAGVIVMILASRVDYIDDAIERAAKDIPRAANMCVRDANRLRDQAKAQLEQTGDKMKKIIKTEATVYLWVSLGLYGAIAACGLVSVMAVDPILAYPARRARPEPMVRRRGAGQVTGAVPSFGQEVYQPPAGAPRWHESAAPVGGRRGWPTPPDA